MSAALRIWRLLDGKPGHEKQTLGLVRALAARTAVEVRELSIADGPARKIAWWWRQRRAAPDLVIGAGHRSHRFLLLARALTGARSVVLMKPSLPRFVFDAVIAPIHDGLKPRPGTLLTRGVLTPMAPGKKDQGAGLVLLGGPSTHFEWDSDAIVRQLQGVLAHDPARRWCIADSRRSPPELLAGLAHPGVEARPWKNCPPDWLQQRLATAPLVWVSADSVSMVYEALSAGARVGILELPPAGARSRVRKGLQALIDDGWVLPFSAWRQGELPTPPPLDEAGRAADWLLARLGANRPHAGAD